LWHDFSLAGSVAKSLKITSQNKKSAKPVKDIVKIDFETVRRKSPTEADRDRSEYWLGGSFTFRFSVQILIP